MEDIEVDAAKGRQLAESGRNVYVFLNSLNDLEIVKYALDSENVQDIDMGEARTIMFRHGSKQELSQIAAKYSGSVIVCPHGRTSLEFSKALSELGISAYSLKGGIEGLKSRQ